MTEHAIIEAFTAEITATGLPIPPRIIPDGKIHRFSTNGKHRNKDGWYFLFGDHFPLGEFGCHRTGIKQTWCAHTSSPTMSETERHQLKARMAAIREQRDAEEQKRRAAAALRAWEIWDKAKPAPADHPYLQRKKIKAHGLRVDAANRLIMPIERVGGRGLSSLQFISPNGEKQFLPGGAVKGGFFPLQREMRYRPTPTPIGVVSVPPAIGIMAEGLATAASLLEATGYPTVCALNKNNLEHLAQFARETTPKTLHLICGDNDLDGGGQRAAHEAAEICNGLAVIPDEPGTDWNDLHVREGVDAVRLAVERILSASGKTRNRKDCRSMEKTAELDQKKPSTVSPDGEPPGATMNESKDHGSSDTLNGDQSKHGKTGSHSPPPANDAHLHTPPALAMNPNILGEFGKAVQMCGVVGEVRCAKLIYLMTTSRLLEEPVSGVVKGLSGSGKSYTTEKTLKFFPREALIIMTAMSERALIYMKEEFSHRTLVIYEVSALKEQKEKSESNLTAYFVRTLLSEGRIEYPVTVRDKEQGWVTKTIVKEGPTNVILTTTATELHGENETRMLSIPTNDSQEQTKAIMQKLAEGKTQTVDFTPWHGLQAWLATQKKDVAIPYASYLAENIPAVAVRLRRDFRSLLRLIETHALLHQYTREQDSAGRIIAIAADYLAVRELVADLIAQGVGATVSETIRETVTVVTEKDKGEGVTVKTVSDALKLDRSAAQRRIQSARERGYIVNLEEKRGKPGRYAVGDPLPEEIDLLPLSLPEGVQHTPSKDDTSMHSLNAEQTNTLSEGVQVCMKTEEIEDDESEEVIDLVD